MQALESFNYSVDVIFPTNGCAFLHLLSECFDLRQVRWDVPVRLCQFGDIANGDLRGRRGVLFVALCKKRDEILSGGFPGSRREVAFGF